MREITQYPSQISDISSVAEYLVLCDDSFHYSDDGYGSSGSEAFIRVLQFKTLQEVTNWIVEETTGSRAKRNASDIKVIAVKSLNSVNIETKVNVSMN